jgi:peptidoglycan/LPS O-acetylase OafA/YrhL
VLRAVAALGVLTGHAYALGGRVLPVKAHYWWDVPVLSTATGVWLFFGISGYVIARPFVDRLLEGRPLPALVPYALRRVLRIYPLYWISLTVVILVTSVVGTSAWEYVVHYALLQNLVPGRQQALFSVAWTLTLEVIFYAAVPLLAFSLSRRRPTPERLAAMVLVSWAASILFTMFADLQGGGKVGLWLRMWFPSMWQMFCPGILLAIAPHLRAPAWRRWLVELPATRLAYAVIGATFVVGALDSADAPLRFGVVGYQLIVDLSRPVLAVCFGLVLAAAIRMRPVRARWALQLGLASYGIYLLHAVLLEFFFFNRQGRDLVPLRHDAVGPYAVHLAFLAALTIPLALASWHWLERPSMRLARTLGTRWQARTARSVQRRAALAGVAAQGAPGHDRT